MTPVEVLTEKQFQELILKIFPENTFEIRFTRDNYQNSVEGYRADFWTTFEYDSFEGFIDYHIFTGLFEIEIWGADFDEQDFQYSSTVRLEEEMYKFIQDLLLRAIKKLEVRLVELRRILVNFSQTKIGE